MKNLLKFLFAMSLLIFLGCKDDLLEIPESENLSSEDFFTKNNLKPVFDAKNDILHFKNTKHFYRFMDFLHEKERNVDTKEKAYLNIGLSQEVREKEANYTDYPVFKLFEQQTRFRSAMTLEEEELFEKLEKGDDEISPIIDRPYLKSMLNKYDAVRIGDRILKFYPNELLAIVANADFDRYHKIKGLASNEIREGYNIRLSSTNKNELSNFYLLKKGRAVEPIITTDLKITQTGVYNNKARIENHSFIETKEEVSYKWTYANGLTSIGFNPDGGINLEEDVCVEYRTSRASRETCTTAAQCAIRINFVDLGGGTFQFFGTSGPDGTNPYISNVTWNFGDCSSSWWWSGAYFL